MICHPRKIFVILASSLLFPCWVYSDTNQTTENQARFYDEPIVKEATIEWPDPDPDESLYLDYDPSYSKALTRDRPSKTVINTRKRRGNHFIPAILVGATGRRLDVQLMLDTGASIVALPESMMSELGISYNETRARKVQTANGVTDALYAKLSALEIGNEIIHNVTVAFIADSSLGGAKLLGMSALRNYTVTLDDKRNTLTLSK